MLKTTPNTRLLCAPLLLLMLCGAACKNKGKTDDSAAASDSKSADATTKGDTFSVPVPDGYTRATDPRLTDGAPGGVVLMADKRALKGAFRGSIVVTRVPPGPEFDPSNEKVCQDLGAESAKVMPVELVHAKLIDTAAGKTCQYLVKDKKLATRKATGTVMYKTRDNCWVVTCNFDARDSAAPKACASVLAGWKFN